jgi:hypothetical protein
VGIALFPPLQRNIRLFQVGFLLGSEPLLALWLLAEQMREPMRLTTFRLIDLVTDLGPICIPAGV